MVLLTCKRMSQLTTIFEVQALITKGKGEQEKPFLEVKVEKPYDLLENGNLFGLANILL